MDDRSSDEGSPAIDRKKSIGGSSHSSRGSLDRGDSPIRTDHKKAKKLEIKLTKNILQQQKKEEKEKEKKKKKEKHQSKNLTGSEIPGINGSSSTNGTTSIEVSRSGETETEAVEIKETVQEEDSYLTSLVETTQLETAVKAVFEANKEASVVAALDAFIPKKEKDIANICNYNYQAFIKAVDELLKVRQDTADLKHSVQVLNKNVQQTGELLLKKYRDLYNLRKMRSNMNVAIDLLEQCQQGLTLLTRSNEYCYQKDYFAALKILEQLELNYLPKVSSLKFAKFVEGAVPNMKEKVRKGAMADINDWLLHVRDLSPKIGKFAMDQMHAQFLQDEKLKFSNTETHDLIAAAEGQLGNAGNKSNQSEVKSPTVPTAKNSQVESDQDITRQHLFKNKEYEIDFTPLYRCLHVHKKLGLSEQFEAYYRENCQLRANGVLKPMEGMSFASIHGYQNYLYNIAGFFIVEMTVLTTTENLGSGIALQKLWETAMMKIKAVLQEQLAYTLEPGVLHQVKMFLFLFTNALQSFGYDTLQLVDFFENVKDSFAEVLVNYFYKDFVHGLDHWDRFEVSDVKEYDKVISANALQIPENRKAPQTFNFSAVVPLYCKLVKAFIAQFYSFGKDLADIDDFVRKSTEKLLKNFNASWLSSIEHTHNLAQMIQSWIDFSVLFEAKSDWEKYLSKLSYSGKMKIITGLDECKKKTEILIQQCVQTKIHGIFESAKSTINWASSGTKLEVRDYATALTTYLDTIIPQLKELPDSVQEPIQLRAFQTISSDMMDMLASPEVHRMNASCIKNFEIDIAHLEILAGKSSVPNAKDALLEPRQLFFTDAH
eukprot:TRINITY_DN10212_c0_g1_i2.p1 TRINITY_DN10212_c0_g1~~TRINITY_DN10212_c0_g1_i2.p1  ORF type:complete len:829 (+),score=293.22 TRINITY_DN10212_c0_g1_i2:114-2600(+)